MRLLKLALISLIILFVIVTSLSLLLPSHVRISRAIDIHASNREIVPYISQLEKWKEWNLFISEGNLHDSLIGPSTLQKGDLNIRLVAVKEDSVRTAWQQAEGKRITSSFGLISSGETTTVQWYFDFYLEWYPWQKFQSIIYDKQMGPTMEASLSRLKNLIETPQ